MIMVKRPEQVTDFDSSSIKKTESTVGSNVTLLDGKSLTLLCPSNGNPKPTITWYKEGVPVTMGERISFGSANELTIENLKVDDAAVYTCVADNGRGRDKVSSLVNVVGS